MSRVPPHNLQAEESMLGAMLLSREAVAACLDVGLEAADFYKPAHGHIYDAVAESYGRGERTDPVTVAEVLRRAGALDLIGGDRTLVTLQAGTPTIGNAAKYARIVGEHAMLRRLIRTCGDITEMAYCLPGDVGAALDEAKERIQAVDLPDHVKSELVDSVTFVAGDDSYDWLVPWLIERGERMLVVAGESGGKALDVETPILTLNGWSKMGDLLPGDYVFAPDGKPTEVLWCSKVQVDRPCYVVRFDDGSEIVADEDHQWETINYHDRQHGRWVPSVHTTGEISRTLKARDGFVTNHIIGCASPPQFPADPSLPVDPYTLGAWLGDGTSRSGEIHSADIEIIERIRAAGWNVVDRPNEPYRWWIGKTETPALRKDSRAMSLSGRLRSLGLIQNKHIPERYFLASVEQRLDLLRGIMDTDGYVDARSQVELTLCNRRLAADAHRLILSMGIKATIRESDATFQGRVVSRRWRILFQTSLPVFSLPRKLARLTPMRTHKPRCRYIMAVEPVESRPVRCIGVDHPSSMFLAGRQLIPTHNSMLLRMLAVCCAWGIHPWNNQSITQRRVVLIDLENPVNLIRRKMRPMVAQARTQRPAANPSMLSVLCRPGGINVAKPADSRWLAGQLAQAKPDLVVCGPLYKMFDADDKWESGARAVTSVLDDLRTRMGFSLILETHAPQEYGGKRNLRPIGSSIWLRWPEFVMSFAPLDAHPHVVRITTLKGRDERHWPTFMERGGLWPWTPCRDPEGPKGRPDPEPPRENTGPNFSQEEAF